MAKKSQSMAARHATPKKSKKKPRQVLRPAQHFDTRSYYREDEDLDTPVASRPVSTRGRFRSTVQVLSSDYHYVVDDLRRIAITAAGLIVVMILLTFIIK